MTEKRRSPRKRILKAGTISFGHNAGIDCTVRNVSQTGAALEIASPIGIPKNFILTISKDGVKRPCEITWQSEHRIGVRFD